MLAERGTRIYLVDICRAPAAALDDDLLPGGGAEFIAQVGRAHLDALALTSSGFDVRWRCKRSFPSPPPFLFPFVHVP